MFKIVNNERLSDNMFRVTFEAPLVARKAQPGQFLMFRVDEFGERMPITISSYDREAGTVSVIMQRVGSTTALWSYCLPSALAFSSSSLSLTVVKPFSP